MKSSNAKKAIILSMLSLLSFGVAFSMSSNELEHINAAECDHVCNHYTKRSASSGASGCKEYWVCCTCHEHFLSAPTAQSITDCGQATEVVNSSDDRYIDPNCTADGLRALGFSSVTENSDGTFTVGSFDKGKSGVIIPEGVTAFEPSTFMGNKCDFVVIPESLEPNVTKDAFKAANKNIHLYFIGNTTKTKDTLEVIAVYKIQGVGWDYVNGAPQAL